MAKKHRPAQDGVAGVVKWFDADEGWGVIVTAEVPGDCFVHFSNIEDRGTASCGPGSTCGSPTRIRASCRMAAGSAP